MESMKLLGSAGSTWWLNKVGKTSDQKLSQEENTLALKALDTPIQKEDINLIVMEVQWQLLWATLTKPIAVNSLRLSSQGLLVLSNEQYRSE